MMPPTERPIFCIITGTTGLQSILFFGYFCV